MTVVITGGTSFLGKYIVNALIEKNCRVIAIIRPTSQHIHVFDSYSNVKTLLYEMDDTDNWIKEIGNADYFLHLGWDGIGAKGRADAVIQAKNIASARACMKAAAILKCKAFLFAGSQAEYGVKHSVISEETICEPVTEYGKAKLAVCHTLSELAEELNIFYYHARIFSVYGEGDHPWALVPTCIRTLCAGNDMLLSSCEQFWNYMHATDAAEVIVELLFSEASPGVYNIASRDTRQLKAFVQDIFTACGGNGKLVFGEHSSIEAPANLSADISKLESVVRVIPEMPFYKAIQKMVQKYRVTGVI